MSSSVTNNTLAQTFDPVKPSPPLFPGNNLHSMIHHKEPLPGEKRIVFYGSIYKSKPYGVSSSYRVLSPQLLLKKHDLVWRFLASTLGLTVAQREVTMRLLRLWAYYGSVYPKESQVTEDPGCSKATFWRTVRILEAANLLQVINRYVIRPHAQISNLYRLDKLVLVIARYLAEHGTAFLEKWLRPYLSMPGAHFWALAFAAARETDFEGRNILPSLVPPVSSK